MRVMLLFRTNSCFVHSTCVWLIFQIRLVGKLFEEIFYYAFNKGETELVLDDVVQLSDSTFGVELEVMKDVFPSFVHSDGSLCEDRLQQAAWLYQREEDDASSSLGDCDSLGNKKIVILMY